MNKPSFSPHCALRPRRLQLTWRERRGSLLLEAIIAIGIFSIILLGIGLALVLGEHQTIAAGDRARAVYIAEGRLEALRQMHTPATSGTMAAGPHGLILGTNGAWTLDGTSTVIGPYTLTVEITPKGDGWMEAAATVQWEIDRTRAGSVTVTTYLTDWDEAVPVGNWSHPTLATTVTHSGTSNFRKIAIANGYAFVTGDRSGGGKGLYVYDLAGTTPVEVAQSFDLGASAEGIAIAGNRLFLGTDAPGQQVQVYDITSPATLSTSNLVTSYSLPGTLRVTSIGVYGTTIFVGTTDNAIDSQFYALEMNETGPMTLLGSLRVDGAVLAMSLHDGYAYLATTSSSLEVQVVDIFEPTNLAYAPGIGMDLDNAFYAQSIASSGTGILVGRLAGDSIEELSLFDTESSPVPPSSSAVSWERGGNVNTLEMIPGTRYAFSGGSTDGSQFAVLNLFAFANHQNPILSTTNTNRNIYGLRYDWDHDRLYAVTDQGLLTFKPQ